MKPVEIKEKRISGLSIRTTNAKEMDPSTGKIGSLWKAFDQQVEVDYRSGYRVYGVYYHYESGATGEYSVLAGTDQPCVNSSAELETIVIGKGRYLVFKASGAVPQIVFETWQRVWDYFSEENTEQQRLFTTDFEYYVHQNEIEIYIAVK